MTKVFWVILIFSDYGSNGVLDITPYPTREACEAAKVAIVESVGRFSLFGPNDITCLEVRP